MKYTTPMRNSIQVTSLSATRLAISCAVIAVLAGCSTTTPAPVVDGTSRGSTRGPVAQPSVPTRPGTVSYPAPIVDRTAPPVSTGTPSVTPLTVTTETGVAQTAPYPGISGTPLPPSSLSSPTLAPPASLNPQAGNTPGSAFHVVQKGENLYRIALNNRIDLNALATWNGITPVTPIREGQVLRLRPPEGDASAGSVGAAGAVAPGTVLSVTPIVSPPSAASAPSRAEPMAQRVPYSDSALAAMQREAGTSSAATSAATAATGASSSTPSAAMPATVAPVIEADIRPGNGVERDGIVWTWPTSGRLTSKFSDKAAMKGVDIAANAGTPVVAAAAGKVIYVGKEPRGFGQMVVVSHAKETVSVYFHTDKVSVKEQQRVTLGQRLAEVSDASSNKMHFEVRRQGRPIDPIALMPSR
jgi:lipoprotein NlpD